MTNFQHDDIQLTLQSYSKKYYIVNYQTRLGLLTSATNQATMIIKNKKINQNKNGKKKKKRKKRRPASSNNNQPIPISHRKGPQTRD